jgi:DNA-binding NtrC family response regulator
MPEAGTILIAVADGVLADSLRFSLEIEGFETRICEERAQLAGLAARHAADCLVLDQDVFTRLVDVDCTALFTRMGIPVVLMVGHKTRRVLARAKAAGVTEVVEKPLLGCMLFEAIRHALDSSAQRGPALSP